MAASLSEVCTVAYVQSVLPSDDTIQGIAISADSVTANAVTNYTITESDLIPGREGLDFCNVTFSYSHTGLDDKVNVWYWMPSPLQFQSRYVSTGGGGFMITSGEGGLAAGLTYGAVAGTTDGGFGGWNNELSDVLLVSNGTINYSMLVNFGFLSIHEMTVLGKTLTKQFYNVSHFYSYYQGCSEGGRKGWSQVQRYGSQFDGAAIGAPAFRQAFQQVNHLFSPVVEQIIGYAPSPCELERINNDTITACDKLDGLEDGIVSRTDLCKMHHFANASVGNTFSCAASGGGGVMGGGAPAVGGSDSSTPAINGTVSAKAAAIAQAIWDGLHDSHGRRVYISYQPSADFADASTTYNSTTGEYTIAASGVGAQWVNLFLKKINSKSLSLDGVSYDTLRDWMVEAMQMYSGTIESTWPDLSDFHNAGGKVIHFHGESDNSIPAASSVIYHNAVREIMYPDQNARNGFDKLHDWYRLFLIPGPARPGPFPVNVLESVIDWVENGVNPTELNATTTAGVDEKICSFPLRPLWKNKDTMTCVYDQQSIDSWLPPLDSIPVPVY
ncbi:Tannase/feruloyl esterase [Gongronella butleri]|nr:Tannase/feruloyl esterase [Gongronella butleri]